MLLVEKRIKRHVIPCRHYFFCELMAMLLLIWLLFWLPSLVFGVPSWYINVDSNKDGGAEMLLGRGSARIEEGDEAGALAEAKQAAVVDLCKMLCCEVVSQNLLREEESNDKLVELFISESSVESSARLSNIQVLNQEVERDAVYVMVGIQKVLLSKTCQGRILDGASQARLLYRSATEMEEMDPYSAISKAQECLSMLREISDDYQVYSFLNTGGESLERKDAMLLQEDVERFLARVTSKTPRKIKGVVEELLTPLIGSMPGSGTFCIYPLEYENTGFISKLGYSIAEYIAVAVEKRTALKRSNNPQEADVVLRGKILSAKRGIHIVLKEQLKSHTKTSQLYIGEITCESIGWEIIRPVNLEQALRDKLALYKALNKDTRLLLEVRTDRMGSDKPVYVFGDRPQLALKANRACYIRLIYVFSDGQRMLLLDNYKVTSEMANQWQHLPISIEICEPAGVEQLLVQGTVGQPMPPLRTKRIQLAEGYYQEIILDSFSEAIMRTRGCKTFAPETALTESTYQWTVFEEP